MEVKARILESVSGTSKKTQKDYTIVMFKTSGDSGRVMKAFSKVSLKEYEEKGEVTLLLDLFPQGDKNFASVQISGVVKPK